MTATARGDSAEIARGLGILFGSGTAAGLSDAELLDRFLTGGDDGASLEALIARHGPMVLGVCRDVLRDGHAAEDAFQATFLVLVRRARAVRVEDSLGRWLYGVAIRVARHARNDQARRRIREPNVSPGRDPAEAPSQDDAERSESRAILHDELQRLPGAQRAAVILCHLEGLTHEQAAQRLRLPVGTVRSRLARARDRLRKRLVRRGVAPVLTGPGLWPGFVGLPDPLRATTLHAALGFTAGKALAGTVPVAVLSLTRGVLSTMLLVKLQAAAALAIAGAALSAGIVMNARAQQSPATAPATVLDIAPRAEAPARATAPAQAPLAPAARPAVAEQPRTSDASLEPPPASARSLPLNPVAAPDPVVASLANGPSSYELGVRLAQARRKGARLTKLAEAAFVSNEEVEAARGDVALIEAQARALREDLADQADRLRLAVRRQQLVVRGAVARRSSAQASLKALEAIQVKDRRNVSPTELSLAQAEAEERSVEALGEEVALEETELRLRQTERRLAAMEALVEDGITRVEVLDPSVARPAVGTEPVGARR